MWPEVLDEQGRTMQRAWQWQARQCRVCRRECFDDCAESGVESGDGGTCRLCNFRDRCLASADRCGDSNSVELGVLVKSHLRPRSLCWGSVLGAIRR